MSALADRKDQWRSLFTHGGTVSERLLKTILPSSLPNLEAVVLSDTNQCTTIPFVSTPRLRTLAISGIPMFFTHCTKLRHLTLDMPSGPGTWKGCTEFIASCDALQRLELRRLQLGELLDMDGRIQNLESHSLKEIELSGCSEATALAVLQHTVSTSVTEFSIGVTGLACTRILSFNILEGVPELKVISIMLPGLTCVCQVVRPHEASNERANDDKLPIGRRSSVQIMNMRLPLITMMGERVALARSLGFVVESNAPRLVIGEPMKSSA
ncbi:hypothetical protein FRB97_001828 [Tulasnella sp. 331]|nr:hypothetical protein FRB97_001828 [Tulasnella sp. 331]